MRGERPQNLNFSFFSFVKKAKRFLVHFSLLLFKKKKSSLVDTSFSQEVV